MSHALYVIICIMRIFTRGSLPPGEWSASGLHEPIIRQTGEIAVQFGCDVCPFRTEVCAPSTGDVTQPTRTFPSKVTLTTTTHIDEPFQTKFPTTRTVRVGAETCKNIDPLFCIHADDITAAANNFAAAPSVIDAQVNPSEERRWPLEQPQTPNVDEL